MASPVRILFYAINGSGLGHLSRLLAIARSLRDLSSALGTACDIRFVTTSEGSGAVWDFPVYKVPSNTVAVSCGLAQNEFVASCRLMVINLIASLRPDMLVTDTVPQGAFGEMSLLAGHVKSMVYIDRHKDPSHSNSPVHLNHLSLYDQVLVPDSADQAARYPLPAGLEERRHFVGYVHGYRADQALSPQAVRDYFGVLGHQQLIFVTAGGGGDPAARRSLQHLVQSLACDPKHFVLVGYGPLYQGEYLYRSNVVPFTEMNVSRYFAGVDLAIAAAGYNSYHELLAAQVPTIFFAQPKGMDRQDERVAFGLAQGWHYAFNQDGAPLELSELSTEQLLDTVKKALAVGAPVGLSKKPAAQGAVAAAAEILGLAATVCSSVPSRGKVFQAAIQATVWGARPGFVGAMQASRYWREFACTAQQAVTEEERSLATWRQCEVMGSTHWSEQTEFHFLLSKVADVRRLCRLWCRKSGRGESELRRMLQDLFVASAHPRLIEALVYKLHAQRTHLDFRDRLRSLMFLMDDPEINLGEVSAQYQLEEEMLALWRVV